MKQFVYSDAGIGSEIGSGPGAIQYSFKFYYKNVSSYVQFVLYTVLLKSADRKPIS